MLANAAMLLIADAADSFREFFDAFTHKTLATIRAFRGHFGPKPKDHLGVEVPGIYWHFVDVMWIIVYSAVYIL